MPRVTHKLKVKLTDMLHKKNLQAQQSSPAAKKSLEK